MMINRSFVAGILRAISVLASVTGPDSGRSRSGHSLNEDDREMCWTGNQWVLRRLTMNGLESSDVNAVKLHLPR